MHDPQLVSFRRHAIIHNFATTASTHALLRKKSYLCNFTDSHSTSNNLHDINNLLLCWNVIHTSVFVILQFIHRSACRNSNNFSNMVGYATHTRSPPWLIGLIFGAFLLDYQQEKQKYLIKSRVNYLVVFETTQFFVIRFFS